MGERKCTSNHQIFDNWIMGKSMKAMESDWYKKIWTLDIQNQSWVEDTNRQVNFLILE